MTIMVAFEGDTDLPVIRRLLEDANLPLGHCGGKARLDAELGGYNGAAKGSPWFVLRDLDDDRPLCWQVPRRPAVQAKPLDVLPARRAGA